MELDEISSPLLKSEDPLPNGSSSSSSAPSPAKRVKSVRIAAGAAVDRIEFEYTDETKWSLGGPGGNKGIPPLVLASDEYIEEVRHEALPQWWYVGAAFEFHTNKGRIFRHVAGWGGGEEDDFTVFRAKPGNCIMSLKIHNGVLEGIVEARAHVSESAALEMFMVYWLESGHQGRSSEKEVKCLKGHKMLLDRDRAGHICDECSRKGTVARCGGGCDYDLCHMCYKHHSEGWASAVQKKGFQARESASRFAERHGAGTANEFVCGPLRIELDDHPWLEAWREFREATRPWLRSCWHNFRSTFAGRRADSREIPPMSHQMMNITESTSESFTLLEDGRNIGTMSESSLEYAGLMVNVVKGTQVRAWGPSDRLAMCRKAAADAGEFNLQAWESRSSSIQGWIDWVRQTVPLLCRVLSLLNWKDNIPASIGVGLCIVFQSCCDGWQPVLTGAVFNLINGDQHEVERESQILHFLCSWTFGCVGRIPLAKSVIFAMMLVSLVQGCTRAFGNALKKKMRDHQSRTLRTAMFEHLLAQDMALYDVLRTRELVGKAELKAMDAVTEWVWSLAAQTVRLGTQLSFLFAISPIMTLVYVVLLPLFEKGARSMLEKGVQAQRRREHGWDYCRHGVIYESVSMIRTVKTFSREDRHVALVAHAVGGAAGQIAQEKKRELRHGAVTVFNDISQKAVYCFCLWCGLVWMERDFSAGDMTAYLLLVQQLGGVVDIVRNNLRELQRRHDMLQEHFEFMDREPQLMPGVHNEDVHGQVSFSDVEFVYPARPDTLVLKGVSFDMQQGETTALVGASGSGKSTIASLLFRYYDPNQGEVKVDGVSLREWSTVHLHSQMALVAQQPLLFDTSIRNNLTYGCRRQVTDEDVHEAARFANAHDFVMGFPAGYDTYVGDQGAHISGGQKQRLSIARAMIMRPQILVLDEATSALDAEAEGVVQDALDKVMVGRTVLVIAHRLSTIKNAHQIVCMRDGRVVESGPPQVLLARQGYYWSLVRRQVCTLDDLSGFNLEIDQTGGGAQVVVQAGDDSPEEKVDTGTRSEELAAGAGAVDEGATCEPEQADDAQEDELLVDPACPSHSESAEGPGEELVDMATEAPKGNR